MAHGGVGTATAAGGGGGGGSRVPERALVLVDISNSYVISWVLLGAPRAATTYHSYRPRMRMRGARRVARPHTQRAALPLARARARRSLSTANSSLPESRGLSPDCAEGYGGLWGFYDASVQSVA